MKIKKVKHIDKKIEQLRQQQQLVSHKISTDFELFKAQALSVQNGFQMAQEVVSFFRDAQRNSMPPKEKVKNIAINTALEVLTQVMEKRAAKPSPTQEDTENTSE